MQSNQRQSEARAVGNDVYRLTGGVANFYLIEDGDALTLVDAGTPGDWELFHLAVVELGRQLKNVEAVVLTHAHADHTGFAERGRREAGSRVMVHESDAGVAKGETPGKNDGAMARYLWRMEFYRTAISLMRRGGAKVVPIVEVSTFGDGEVLDVPGKPRAIHAPGHTPGNAALLLEDRDILLSGDTLITRNPLTGRVGPQIMPSGFNRDTSTALASLSALEVLKVETILPGHGEPWTGAMRDAVSEARRAGRS